jgi:hypothetical protein
MKNYVFIMLEWNSRLMSVFAHKKKRGTARAVTNRAEPC